MASNHHRAAKISPVFSLVLLQAQLCGKVPVLSGHEQKF
jgi:hypothetical protein